MARRLVLGSAAAVLVVAGLLPLVTMALHSVLADGHLSLAAYRAVLRTERGAALLAHSLALAAWTTAMTTAVGLPLGLLLGRTDLPGRRLLTLLFTVPLTLPPFIMAVGWSHALDRHGPLAMLASPHVLAIGRNLLFGLPGCVLVLSTTFLPVVMLLTRASLIGVSPRLEEAARLQARWPTVWRDVTIPLIRPGVGFAALLVFLLSLGELSVPMYLHYPVYPVESFTQFSASYDFRAATASAVPLAAVALLVLLGEGRLRQAWALPLRTSSGDERLAVKLGPARRHVLAAAILLATGLVVAPILGLAAGSASLEIYVEALSRAGDSLARSLLFAAVGASAVTAVGFLVGYAAHARALVGWRAVDALSLVLFATPGTVLGIGEIGLWNRPGIPIYGTPALLFLAWIAQYTALTSRITQSVLAGLPASMEEAGRTVGAGWSRRMVGIVVPLARPGLAAAWLVGYMFCLRDTGVTMLLSPPGLEPLNVHTLTLMANGSPALIAALCVLTVAAALLPLGLLALARPEGSHGSAAPAIAPATAAEGVLRASPRL